MADSTQIQWTDATWNPTTGCTKVSPGCAHCYIERTPAFRITGRRFVAGATDLRLHPDRLAHPLHWRKPRRVFVNSLSDLFHSDIPDAFIDRVFAVMALTPHHTYQILTKRADRMREYFRSFNTPEAISRAFNVCEWAACLVGWEKAVGEAVERVPRGLPNVWLGVSVENQHFADERIPLLLQTPAAVRFISAEPLLEAIDVEPYLQYPPTHEHYKLTFGATEWRGLDWVIVGGESGPGARPFELSWARSILAECRAAGVACFVKQVGSRPMLDEHDTLTGWPDGAHCDDQDIDRVVLRDPKGGDPAEWPDDLQVREFPA